MALAVGMRLGAYELIALVGAGGMGEVYRARDTKLNRDIAVKVLPAAVAADSERLARFEREAQVLAALNHPYIAQIHGLEDSAGVPALVMEFVDGPTLADRIAQGPIPVEEALAIATSIAEALDAAHRQSIVHRDLKPANVKVRADGTVKVLDFGLAKPTAEATAAASLALTGSPTITSPAMMTGVGVILGTAAYMSPEQAKGTPVDSRTDVWAFGCLLYEMLVGRRAFDRADVPDTLAAVLRDEPDLTRVPARMRRLLQSCLQKDPKQRLQAIGDWRLLLDAGAESLARPTSGLAWGIAAVTTMFAAAAALGWWWTWRPAPPTRPMSRWAVELPQFGRDLWPSLSVSRDGTRVAYLGGNRPRQMIYVRMIDRLESQPIAGTEGAWSPFFSPDGRWIGYFAEHALKKVPATGGASITICDWPDAAPPSGTWGPDDSIVFSGGAQVGLSRVAASGGEVQVLLAPDRKKGEAVYIDPQYSPDGKGVLFWIAPVTLGTSDGYVAALDLATGQKTILQRGAYRPRFVPGGYLVFMREATLFAVRFDAERLRMRGTPVPVLEAVAGDVLPALAFSDTGTLVYVQGGVQRADRMLVWVNRNGQEQPLAIPPGTYDAVRLSPDGKRVAFAASGPTMTDDIYVDDLERGTLSRLTFESDNTYPVWTPDGKRLAFTSGGRGLFWMPSDASGRSEQILATEDTWPPRPGCWTPDGKALIVTRNGETNRRDLWIVPVAAAAGADGKPRPLLETPFEKYAPRLSPDGRWLAYWSVEPGKSEVYVQPFPGLDGKWQVSSGGGRTPVWAPSGRELYYLSSDGTLMAVTVDAGANFRMSTPRALLERRYPSYSTASSFDVSPDGMRFLFIKQAATDTARTGQVVVVTEWFDELRRLVAAGNK